MSVLALLVGACSSPATDGGQGATPQQTDAPADVTPDATDAATAETPDATEAATATEEAPPERASLNVAQLSPAPVLYANLWIAEVLGYYEEEALDVELTGQVPRGTAMDAMVLGEFDIAGTSNAYVIAYAAERDTDEVQIFMNDLDWFWGVWVLPDSEVQTVSDLAGMTIGTREQADDSVANLQLTASGELTPEDYELLPVGGRAVAGVALQNGDIDAFMGSLFDEHFIREAGVDIRLVDLGVDFTRFYNSGYSTTRTFLEENRDVIVRFGRALAKATIWQIHNPEMTIELLGEIVPEAVEEDPEGSLALLTGAVNPASERTLEERLYANPENWQELIDVYADVGVIDESFPATNIVTDDPELIEEIWDFDVEQVIADAEAGRRP